MTVGQPADGWLAHERRRRDAAPGASCSGGCSRTCTRSSRETPLEEVRTFERFMGGYGGNVGIGLARLGVRTAVVSGVGDDGHGRAIIRTLAAEGVDTRWLVGPPHAPHRARVLRAVAARPLPAARLPLPELPRPGDPPGGPAAGAMLAGGTPRLRVGQRVRTGPSRDDGVRGARAAAQRRGCGDDHPRPRLATRLLARARRHYPT